MSVEVLEIDQRARKISDLVYGVAQKIFKVWDWLTAPQKTRKKYKDVARKTWGLMYRWDFVKLMDENREDMLRLWADKDFREKYWWFFGHFQDRDNFFQKLLKVTGVDLMGQEKYIRGLPYDGCGRFLKFGSLEYYELANAGLEDKEKLFAVSPLYEFYEGLE